jgi:hypothetical protein
MATSGTRAATASAPFLLGNEMGCTVICFHRVKCDRSSC